MKFPLLWCLFCSFLLISRGKSTKSTMKSSRSKTGSTTRKVDAKKSSGNLDGPSFRIIAEYVTRYSDDEELTSHSAEEIERAIATIAAAQTAWKSMDGATHQLKSTFKTSTTSLSNRHNKFLEKKSRNTKEAAKLLEYITTVERGMQSCELLQATMQLDESTRIEFLRAAGLNEVQQFTVSANKVSCTVTVLLPASTTQDAPSDGSTSKTTSGDNSLHAVEPDEVVIVVTDDIHSDSELNLGLLLRAATTDDVMSLPVSRSSSIGNGRSKSNSNSSADKARKASGKKDGVKAASLAPNVTVMCTFLDLATQIEEQLRPLLAKAYRLRGNQPEESDRTLESDADHEDDHDDETVAPSLKPAFGRVRIVGHSAGGAVGAYLATLLDGFLTIPSSSSSFPSTSSSLVSNGGVSLQGLYAGRVRCLSLGPPPCLSRSVIPNFVTSIICGDDIVCRAQRESLAELRHKVTVAVSKGAGKRGLGWFTGASLLSELSLTAGKQLGKYQGRKKDKRALHLPGRVFFIKSRQLKQGATIQRVLRGNWQEDVLWNIRDIVISTKMLEHHGLAAYLRTLNRC